MGDLRAQVYEAVGYPLYLLVKAVWNSDAGNYRNL
jgi:hypothetical protein